MKLKKSLKGDFVPIRENGKLLYGGYQNMLEKKGVVKFYRDRSCVVTAFTNVYLYLFRNDKIFDFDDYNYYQYWFFKVLKPKIYGIPTARILDFKLNRLRNSYHLKLKSHILEDSPISRKSIEDIAKFINGGLSKDLPVIFFNWLSIKYDFMNHHGVTITELIKKDEDYILTLSSWARLYKISLIDFLKQARTYTGFIYFERES